jgi:hypothetical protein
MISLLMQPPFSWCSYKLPNASIRYNRTTNIFEEWDLTTWNPKVIGLLGGGTGVILLLVLEQI